MGNLSCRQNWLQDIFFVSRTEIVSPEKAENRERT
jgi:hypothetical protein